jgi:SAM-dependent methyltransferase
MKIQVKPTALLAGIVSRVPVFRRLVNRSTGGALSARYCYSVWLRHLVMARKAGLPGGRLECVAELGPGDSLGMGLAALLSGAERYFAFDVKAYAPAERNRAVLEELIDLFSRRAPIPGEDEFPAVWPRLADYAFPREVLTEELLTRSLDPGRLAAIKAALGPADNIRIRYVAPWDKDTRVEAGSVDMVFSQAVMEHVDDPEAAYAAMYRWLRAGGFVSHQIDLRSHGTTRDWNGHWTLSDPVWELVRGKRTYSINRLPRSAHVRAVERAGFELVGDSAREGPALRRKLLAPRFRDLEDDDLKSSGVFLQAQKL